jgi:AsmA protein
MKKLLKIFVGFLIFYIIAIAAASYFISAEGFKKPLLNKIEAATGRHITVDGKLQLKLFPAVAIGMENVTLANPPGFNDVKPLMTLKSLDVAVAVFPLLKGTLEVKKLVLDEPQVTLHVNKDGAKNWVWPQQASTATAAPAGEPAPAARKFVPVQNLMLNDVKMTNASITYDDEVTKQKLSLQKMSASLSLGGADSPFGVDGSAEWNGKKITVKGTLSTLRSFLSGQATKIDAAVTSDLLSVNATGTIENAVYSGTAKVQTPSLKTLNTWINPNAAPIAAQGVLALSLSSDMACSAHECAMSDTSLLLDNFKAKGTIKANWEKKPQVDANLTTNVIDFNAFMPAQHANASSFLFPDAYAETNGHWSEKPMDLSALQAVNGSANIVADGIVANKITIGKTTLKAKLENGHLDADVIDAALYNGKGNITLNADTAAAVPTFTKHVTLKGVQVQPLLKDALDLSRLSGTADIEVQATSHGRSQKELVDSAAGNGQFVLNNGTIQGVDIASIALKRNSGAQATPINDMKGTFTIAQGVISNKDLVMDMPTLHVAGEGDINLPAFTINYHLAPQVVQQQQAATGKAVTPAKQGVAVPVIIEGSLEKPAIHPDLNAVAQNALKDPKAFKQQLKTTRDSLKNGALGNNPDAVKKNLKNLLQGL